MAVSIYLVITQNSQSIANNTSNVTVRVNASWTGGSFNGTYPPPSGWLEIDGTRYNFSSTFNYPGQTNTGGCELFQKTVNVSHNSDGSKTLYCSASFATGVSSGTVTASASKTLTRIARKSSISVKTGTLGTATTITVSRQADSLTHTITYTCGKASGTICTKSSNTSISWTPPISLAAQYPTETSIPIVYTITTYSGNTNVGSSTSTMGYSVPASVKPSCTISITDPTGISDIYGSPVQGLSKFAVTVNATTSQGSAISTYKSTANGSTYTSKSFETGVLKSSGTLTVSSTVTDKRGRSGSNSASKTVIAYSNPAISNLSVKRCDDDGSANDRGECMQINFTANITYLDGKNIPKYTLKYKRSSESDSEYIERDVVEDFIKGDGIFTGSYSTGYQYISGYVILPAETGSSYDIEFDAEDRHNRTSRTTSVSTAFTLMHWNVAGNGMGIGKVSELEYVLDIGIQTRFQGGILYNVLDSGANLNYILAPGFYIGENVSTYNYENCPLTSGTFTLEVLSMGPNGQLMQRLTQCNKTVYIVHERVYYGGSWGPWSGEWHYPDLSSYFAVYEPAVPNRVRYRKDGRVVEILGVVTPVSTVTPGGMYLIFTLPTGYRPTTDVHVVRPGNSYQDSWVLHINAGGDVSFSRYNNGTTGVIAQNGYWLPLHATFIADK